MQEWVKDNTIWINSPPIQPTHAINGTETALEYNMQTPGLETSTSISKQAISRELDVYQLLKLQQQSMHANWLQSKGE